MKNIKLTKDELKELEAKLPNLHGREHDIASGILMKDFWNLYSELNDERLGK